jgi:preprotein translocase SecE subunit
MSNEPNDPKKESGQAKAKPPTAIATPKFKRGLKGFIADTKREMNKVNWPTKKETTRLTSVVLSLVIVIAVMLSLMGWASDTVVALITKGKI